MNENNSWDSNRGSGLEEFWGDRRGRDDWRKEEKGAMNKYLELLLRFMTFTTCCQGCTGKSL